ncbi:MAG: CAP domain-containing protein [Acidimicrobiia bacterium]|nr:CAP domain-containing protein [Acidimicrobiia bacterium]
MVVLVGIAIFVGFSRTAHAAQSTGDAENTLTADINQERTSRGLGALSTASDLVAYARQHSADMAAAGHPYHDPNIQSNVQNWQHLGDNVGSGPDADHLHQGFMNSQVHRDEILMPDYTEVGVGAYWAGDVLYVTEVFRRPEAAAVPVVRTVTAPAPRPAPAPRIVVRPAAPAAAVAPAPVVTTPPTAAPAPASSTSTSLVAAATTPWPPASAVLNTRSAASHGARSTDLATVAVAAAVLLMLVAGVEVATLRRRAERS